MDLFTVRWSESHPIGQAWAYIDDTEHGPLPVDITSVDAHRMSELAPQILQLKKGSGVDGYVSDLRDHYPTVPEDAEVDVATFRLSAANI